MLESLEERIARAACAQSPTKRHVRIVTADDEREMETCRYCEDVKEHPPVRFGDMPDMGEPDSRLPAVPKGFQLIE